MSADGALYTAKDIEFWNKGDDGVLEWRGEKAKCALDN
jgi:membrane-bound inhibitor of C-type lysozyme